MTLGRGAVAEIDFTFKNSTCRYVVSDDFTNLHFTFRIFQGLFWTAHSDQIEIIVYSVLLYVLYLKDLGLVMFGEIKIWITLF